MSAADKSEWFDEVRSRTWSDAIGMIPAHRVLVAGDIRDNVFSARQLLVAAIKNDVVTEWESR